MCCKFGKNISLKDGVIGAVDVEASWTYLILAENVSELTILIKDEPNKHFDEHD